jgi:hypothetical protein
MRVIVLKAGLELDARNLGTEMRNRLEGMGGPLGAHLIFQ